MKWWPKFSQVINNHSIYWNSLRILQRLTHLVLTIPWKRNYFFHILQMKKLRHEEVNLPKVTKLLQSKIGIRTSIFWFYFKCLFPAIKLLSIILLRPRYYQRVSLVMHRKQPIIPPRENHFFQLSANSRTFLSCTFPFAGYPPRHYGPTHVRLFPVNSKETL